MLRNFIVPTNPTALIYLWPCLVMAQNHKQPNLTFQTDFFHAVNHWVVLPKKPSDSQYLYGYLYFDPNKGMRFVLENTLSFDGTWQLNRATKTYVLQKSMQDPTLQVALIPKAIRKQWNLPKIPATLSPKLDIDSAEYCTALANYYNHQEQSSLAVPLLKKALQKNPTHPQLLFELGYAYNAMARYKKAIRVLEALTQKHPAQKAWQELGYAYLQTKQISIGEHCYSKAVGMCESREAIQTIGRELHAVLLNLRAFSYLEKWEMIAKKGEIPSVSEAEN